MEEVFSMASCELLQSSSSLLGPSSVLPIPIGLLGIGLLAACAMGSLFDLVLDSANLSSGFSVRHRSPFSCELGLASTLKFLEYQVWGHHFLPPPTQIELSS